MSLIAFVTAADEHDLRVRVVREPSGEPGMRWLVMAEGDPLAGYVVSPIAFGRTPDDAAERLLRRLQQAGALRPAPAEIVEGDQGGACADKSRHTPASDATGTKSPVARQVGFCLHCLEPALSLAGSPTAFHHRPGCPNERPAA